MSAGGDHVIVLKGNQKMLYKAVFKHFRNPFDMNHCKFVDVSEIKESNRARIEQRKC